MYNKLLKFLASKFSSSFEHYTNSTQTDSKLDKSSSQIFAIEKKEVLASTPLVKYLRTFGSEEISRNEIYNILKGNDNLSTKKYLFSNVHTKSIRNRTLLSFQQQKNLKVSDKTITDENKTNLPLNQSKEELTFVNNKADTLTSSLIKLQLEW